MLVLFTASFLIMGVLGVKAPTPARTALAQICSIFYFAFFLLMPIWSAMDKTKPVPKRVTMDGGIGFWGSMGALAVIAARLEVSQDTSRPLLTAQDRLLQLTELHAARRDRYAQADLHIQPHPEDTPEAIATAILAAIPSVTKDPLTPVQE